MATVCYNNAECRYIGGNNMFCDTVINFCEPCNKHICNTRSHPKPKQCCTNCQEYAKETGYDCSTVYQHQPPTETQTHTRRPIDKSAKNSPNHFNVVSTNRHTVNHTNKEINVDTDTIQYLQTNVWMYITVAFTSVVVITVIIILLVIVCKISTKKKHGIKISQKSEERSSFMSLNTRIDMDGNTVYDTNAKCKDRNINASQFISTNENISVRNESSSLSPSQQCEETQSILDRCPSCAVSQNKSVLHTNKLASNLQSV